MSSLTDYAASCKARVDASLRLWTQPSSSASPRLLEAMRYSLFNGGKRIRPVLVYAAADAIKNVGSIASPITDVSAAALECIHAYSLIHDDLPAMDDDDLRRGKPTCHIAFDQATAILAGDALQALAYEKLAEADGTQADILLNMLALLARASGAKGMVGGQMADLLAEGQAEALSVDELEQIHRSKTGALISSAVQMGALSSSASTAQFEALTAYASAIGLAFQVQDDIIDVISDTETLGKPQGADLSQGKSTYVSLLGLDNARQKAEQLRSQALDCLSDFGACADPLRWIANYIVERRA